MKRLIIATLLVLSLSATAQGPGAAANYSAASVVSADKEMVPMASEYRIDVDEEVIAALTELAIQLHERGAKNFSSWEVENYVRLDYEETFLSSSEKKTVDLYYDSERVACFGKKDWVRCFAQIGSRSATGKHRVPRLSNEPFLYYQSEILLRTESDGSLKPTRRCIDGECREIE